MPRLRRLAPALLAVTAIALPSIAAAATPSRRVIVVAEADASAATLLAAGAVVDELRGRGAGWTVLPFGVEVRGKLLRELEQAAAQAQAGRDAFDSLELDGALRVYGRAVQSYERLATSTLDLAPLAEALSMLAAVELLTGQEKKAVAHLEWLAILRPELETDPAVFNPQMVASVERTRRVVRDAKPRLVDIHTGAARALVYVDGNLAGASPCALPLAPGKHIVHALAPGFQLAGRVLTVAEGKRDAVELKLVRAADSAESERLAKAALRALVEDDEVSSQAIALARLYEADEVILVACDASSCQLARDTPDGSTTQLRTYEGSIIDLESARAAAERLLTVGPERGPIAAPPPRRAASAATLDLTAPPTRDARSIHAVPAAIAVTLETSAQRVRGRTIRLGVLTGLYGASALAAAGAGAFGLLTLRAHNDFAAADQISADAWRDDGQRQARRADTALAAALGAALAGVAVQLLWTTSP